MLFGSVCSGIEAASVAWHPLGWKAAWLAEIEPFPKTVLAHHYPDVPNLGDMTKIAASVRAGLVLAPDVLVGGTPCQAFSVAGLRGGLSDARGQLTLSFVELANEIDAARLARGEQPVIVIWENVPGVLSSKDNAFGCFLGALAGEDCELKPAGKRWPNAGCVFGPTRTVAWRVLDAQYFGVAQRRRRVFVVASARDGFDPTAVLFESEGVRRDTPPRREAGKDTTGSTGDGVARCLTTGEAKRQDWETCNMVAHTLRADGFDASEDGTGRGTPLVATVAPTLQARTKGGGGLGTDFDCDGGLIAFSCKDHGADAGDISPTLRSMGHDGSHANSGGQVAVAFAQNQRDEVRQMDVAGALAAEPGMKQQTYLALAMAVRRLTPRECERLQGFPDDYTAIPWRGKPASECPDGPRYKALGNSMAVPCMAWIGRRIKAALGCKP